MSALIQQSAGFADGTGYLFPSRERFGVRPAEPDAEDLARWEGEGGACATPAPSFDWLSVPHAERGASPMRS